jgi:hypothetical protein
MKKSLVLITWLAIFIVSHFMFSCKTSIEVEKRHYRSGYFLGIGSGKRHVKKALFSGIEAVVKDTTSTGKTETEDNSAIFKEDSVGSITASIRNEISITENKPLFSITARENRTTLSKSKESQPPKIIIKNNRRDTKATPPPHNTGKILRIVGTIVGVIGVLIFLGAYPANLAGMVIGRLLLSLGLITDLISLFF